jgi:peptidoglycan L-alanyl-D-glutamate endopeptidase CwlK
MSFPSRSELENTRSRLLSAVATIDSMLQVWPKDGSLVVPAPETTPASPKFKLGNQSRAELTGVDPRLVRCVELAITLTTQDFTVHDGIRTKEEQAKHVANGTSQTMKSKHLDGLAVDLVPWVGGRPVWDWNRIYPIAKAMDDAATKLGYADKIRWGGAWDRVLSDFGGDVDAYKKECELYAARHPGKDFLDGPHFEWVR